MLAVITINYNLSHETIPCVESVIASDYQDLVVYLIDNGSTHDDYLKLRSHFTDNEKVSVLRIESNCGYVGGVNFGLRKALEESPDYILIMNNDTVLDRSAIGYLTDAAQRHQNRAIISGKVYYYDHPDILQHTGEVITDRRYLKAIAPGRNERDTGQYDVETERDALDDVFWLLPLQVVEDVGFYCDSFFLYAEQGDYALRARDKGYKLIYTPAAKIWHKVSMTTGNGNPTALPVCFWRGQGLFLLQYRHLKTRHFIVMLLKWVFKLFLNSIIKPGDAGRCSFAQLRGYLWGLGWVFNKGPNDGANPYIRRR